MDNLNVHSTTTIGGRHLMLKWMASDKALASNELILLLTMCKCSGSDGKWKHTLVLLRINRAATCVRWSPQENKFAVG